MMQRFVRRASAIGLALSILILSACGKDASQPAGTISPKTSATESAVTANSQAAAKPVEPSTSAPSGADAAKPAQPEDASEQVAETDDGNDKQDDAVSKGTAPLKLAQLPPRVPAGSKFKEGVNYTRLSPAQPVNVSPDQVSIVEFFWYGCPHCNALDPKVEAWRKGGMPGGKPDYVTFSRSPGAWNDISRFHGRFYFAAESLGKLDELHSAIFQEIHVKGNPLNTIDRAREFFAAHGVDAQAFQKAFGAMSLERKLDDANTFAQRSRITGVPTFIVNGKYTVDVDSAGGEEQLFVLLNELAAREHNKE